MALILGTSTLDDGSLASISSQEEKSLGTEGQLKSAHAARACKTKKLVCSRCWHAYVICIHSAFCRFSRQTCLLHAALFPFRVFVL